MRWHELITSRITDTVKLVGPTISCEGSPKDGNVNGEWRTNPHVQSYVLATDQVLLHLKHPTRTSALTVISQFNECHEESHALFYELMYPVVPELLNLYWIFPPWDLWAASHVSCHTS